MTTSESKQPTKRDRESALQRAVKSLLRQLGIHYYVNTQGPIWGNVRGRPDMEVIKDGITYYLELKRYRQGKMSRYQEQERRKIEAAGAPYVVVREIKDVVEALGLRVII